MPAACKKHFPSIRLHPLTKHLTLGRGVQASSLLPLLPSEPSFPPAAVCLGGGRRRETKRQRARLTTRAALPRGRRAQAGGALPLPAAGWLGAPRPFPLAPSGGRAWGHAPQPMPVGPTPPSPLLHRQVLWGPDALGTVVLLGRPAAPCLNPSPPR